MSEHIKQAGTFGPFLQASPCYAMTYGMKRVFGKLNFSKLYIFYSNNYGAVYYSREEAKKVGDYYLNRVIKNKNFISSEYQSWLVDFQRLEDLGKGVVAEKDGKAFRQFYGLYINLWARSIFVEVYDEDITERILKLARKYNVDIDPKEIITLTQPKYVSMQLIFEKDLLDALIKKKALNKLAAQYYFLDVDYLTASRLALKRRIKEITRRGVDKEGERIKKLIDKAYRDYQEKQTVIKEKKFPKDLARIFDFFTLTIEWRDVRKKMHQIGGYYVWRYIMEKIELPNELKPYMMVQDYFDKSYLDRNYIETLAKRKKYSLVIIGNEGSIDWVYDKDKIDKLIGRLEEEEKVFTEIKGNVANRGVVEGIVKVIKSAKDFKKMRQGDILVAPMTRSEYMPLIKLASAIVTDEGGITCHAAIVSREMQKPCIIGTKVATKVLKDGDWVEVDAEKGIVIIVERVKWQI